MTDGYPPPPGYPPPNYPTRNYPTHGYWRGEPSLLMRTVLDRQVAESRSTRPPWPARTIWGPFALLVGLIVALNVVARLLPHRAVGSSTGLVVSVVAEIVLVVGVVALIAPVARAEGGWSRAFGLQWVRGGDWLPWLTGIGMVIVSRIVLAIVVVSAFGVHAVSESSNLQLTHITTATVVALIAIAVVLAPAVEELIFRGVMLRALMRRMRFWPAALISSVVFGGLHAYEVRTVAGAVTLSLMVAALGLINCYLVRITGRLTPGIMLHATANLVSVLVLVARG